MADHILHFTLGPVQGFVGQARRTRDYWAGSFLLSWLSGVAMRAIVDGKYGKIDFPDVSMDPLFLALGGNERAGPRIGSLPNRFRASIRQGGIFNRNRFDATSVCAAAVQTRWNELAGLVWKTFVEHAADAGGSEGGGPRRIWERQIAGFWDMSWVVGASDGPKEDGKWLDQRKNWRTWWPPDEPGDHCMLMGDWQELSGWVRARGGERQKQLAFWAKVDAAISAKLYDRDVSNLELGETERLCAPALVKRLFSVLFDERMTGDVRAKAEEIIGFIPCGDVEKDKGEAVRIWRSTAHIAATPWLRRIAREHRGAVDRYVGTVSELAGKKGASGIIFAERASSIPSLDGHRMARLDGALFFEDSLLHKDARAWGRPLSRDWKMREELAQHLANLQKATKPGGRGRQAKGGKPSPFFALLLMDGDNMGKLIAESGGESSKVAKALAEFTKSAAELQGDHVTVYAGGDDYLGLFPLPDVLQAALELRKAYLNAFRNQITGSNATVSAGIVFAPYDAPLTQTIRDAHVVLDEVAKDRNGRDSIAVRVRKSSGEMATWAAKWEEQGAKVAALAELASAMAVEDEHSSSYLYKIERLYGAYYEAKYRASEGVDRKEEERLHKILLAERLVGRDAEKERQRAEQHVAQVLAACLTRGGPQEKKIVRFSLGGAMIARFLADNGFQAGGPGGRTATASGPGRAAA